MDNLAELPKTTTTVIRLKRRRGAALPTTLRIAPDDETHHVCNDRHSKKTRSSSYAALENNLSNLLSSSINISSNRDAARKPNMVTTEEEKFEDIVSPSSKVGENTKNSKKPIIFKRVLSESCPSNKKRKNEMVRLVDCVHNEDKVAEVPQATTGHYDSNNNQIMRSNKRAKISIVSTVSVDYQDFLENQETDGEELFNNNTSTEAKKQHKGAKSKRSTRILSPVENRVITHLKDYLESGPLSLTSTTTPGTDETLIFSSNFGGCSYMNFLRLEILPNSTFVMSPGKGGRNHQTSSSPSSSNSITRFLNMTFKEMGTVLHGAALWNDIEGAQQFLENGIDIRIQDGDGNTALDVAKMIGHDSVVELIQKKKDSMIFEDEDDYVYDFYYVDTPNTEDSSDNGKAGKSTQEKNSNNSQNKDKTNDDDDWECIVELKNGRGYWDQNGTLVIEPISSSANQANDGSNLGCDDDYDSNDEDHIANDYPEEDSYGYGDDDDDDDYTWEKPERMQMHTESTSGIDFTNYSSSAGFNSDYHEDNSKIADDFFDDAFDDGDEEDEEW